MEYDRYQQNHAGYIIALLSLVTSLAMFAFTLYILPPLIWEWDYHIPQFVWDWQEYLHMTYDYTYNGAAWVLVLSSFCIALVSGIIAWIFSNRIDNAIFHVNEHREENKSEKMAREDAGEAFALEMKIFFLIVLVLIGALLLQWFISLTA